MIFIIPDLDVSWNNTIDSNFVCKKLPMWVCFMYSTTASNFSWWDGGRSFFMDLQNICVAGNRSKGNNLFSYANTRRRGQTWSLCNNWYLNVNLMIRLLCKVSSHLLLVLISRKCINMPSKDGECISNTFINSSLFLALLSVNVLFYPRTVEQFL